MDNGLRKHARVKRIFRDHRASWAKSIRVQNHDVYCVFTILLWSFWTIVLRAMYTILCSSRFVINSQLRQHSCCGHELCLVSGSRMFINYHGSLVDSTCSVAALLNFHVLHIQIEHLMYTGIVRSHSTTFKTSNTKIYNTILLFRYIYVCLYQSIYYLYARVL